MSFLMTAANVSSDVMGTGSRQERLRTYSELARCALYAHDWETAEYFFTWLPTEFRDELGKDDRLTLDLDAFHALYLANRDQAERADEKFEITLPSMRRELGEQDLSTLLALNNWALVKRQLGDLESAEQMLVKAWAGLNQPGIVRFAPDRSLDAANNLVLIRNERGFYRKTQPLAYRAQGLWEQRVGRNHPGWLRTSRNLGRTLNGIGSWALAIGVLEGAAKLGLEKHSDSYVTGQVIDALIRAFVESGDTQSAKKWQKVRSERGS